MILVGNLEIFDDKRCKGSLKKVLTAQFPKEQILFCVITDEDALVVLGDRLVHTYMGMQVETHFLRDILSLETYDVLLSRGVILKCLNGGVKIPFSSKKDMDMFAPYARQLTELLARAKSPLTPTSSGTSAPGEHMISQLERLATLHAAGDLTDEEFQMAKAKLLGA